MTVKVGNQPFTHFFWESVATCLSNFDERKSAGLNSVDKQFVLVNGFEPTPYLLGFVFHITGDITTMFHRYGFQMMKNPIGLKECFIVILLNHGFCDHPNFFDQCRIGRQHQKLPKAKMAYSKTDCFQKGYENGPCLMFGLHSFAGNPKIVWQSGLIYGFVGIVVDDAEEIGHVFLQIADIPIHGLGTLVDQQNDTPVILLVGIIDIAKFHLGFQIVNHTQDISLCNKYVIIPKTHNKKLKTTDKVFVAQSLVHSNSNDKQGKIQPVSPRIVDYGLFLVSSRRWRKKCGISGHCL